MRCSCFIRSGTGTPSSLVIFYSKVTGLPAVLELLHADATDDPSSDQAILLVRLSFKTFEWSSLLLAQVTRHLAVVVVTQDSC